MKKSFYLSFIILILFVSTNTFSQIDKPILKGNILLGGSADLEYQSTTNINDMAFLLQPEVGYFFVDHLAVGVTPLIQLNHSSSPSVSSNSFALGIGPFVRYYFNNGLFLHLSADYSGVTFKETNFPNQTGSNYQIEPAIGYAFFINQKVSLDFKLGYMYNASDQNGTHGYNNILSLAVGLQIFL